MTKWLGIMICLILVFACVPDQESDGYEDMPKTNEQTSEDDSTEALNTMVRKALSNSSSKAVVEDYFESTEPRTNLHFMLAIIAASEADDRSILDSTVGSAIGVGRASASQYAKTTEQVMDSVSALYLSSVKKLIPPKEEDSELDGTESLLIPR